MNEEVVVMCYSYRDRKLEEEARRTEQEQRRRREERAKKESGERRADKDRELVRA